MANEHNLRPCEYKLSQEEAKKGGINSGKARRERKTLRDLLLAELDKDSGDGLTKGQYLVAKAMQNHAKGKLTFKDLKDLADILGESIQNINMQSDTPFLVVSKEVAEAMKKD